MIEEGVEIFEDDIDPQEDILLDKYEKIVESVFTDKYMIINKKLNRIEIRELSWLERIIPRFYGIEIIRKV
jgi:hypothetical protein